MRLLADLHISPSTVRFLRDLGHDVNDVLARILPQIEEDLARGAAITVEEGAIRRRPLPIE